MSDVSHTQAPVSIKPQVAFNVYLGLGDRRTVAETARVLKEAGEKIGPDTIYKWAKKHRWDWRINLSATDTISTEQASDVLSKLGESLSYKNIDGLQIQLVKHILSSVDGVAISNPADMGKMIENVEKLRGISHNMRGSEVKFDAEDRHQANGHGNLIDLGEFKKPKYD